MVAGFQPHSVESPVDRIAAAAIATKVLHGAGARVVLKAQLGIGLTARAHEMLRRQAGRRGGSTGRTSLYAIGVASFPLTRHCHP